MSKEDTNTARLSVEDLIAASFGIAREHSEQPPELVRIFGMGIGKDGTMRAAVKNMIPRWEFTFARVPRGGFVSVLWMAAAMSGKNEHLKAQPLIDGRAGNISDDAAPLDRALIGELGNRVPSGAEVAQRALDHGGELAFRDEDCLIYHVFDNENVVDVVTANALLRFRLEDLELVFKTGR